MPIGLFFSDLSNLYYVVTIRSVKTTNLLKSTFYYKTQKIGIFRYLFKCEGMIFPPPNGQKIFTDGQCKYNVKYRGKKCCNYEFNLTLLFLLLWTLMSSSQKIGHLIKVSFWAFIHKEIRISLKLILFLCLVF